MIRSLSSLPSRNTHVVSTMTSFPSTPVTQTFPIVMATVRQIWMPWLSSPALSKRTGLQGGWSAPRPSHRHGIGRRRGRLRRVRHRQARRRGTAERRHCRAALDAPTARQLYQEQQEAATASQPTPYQTERGSEVSRAIFGAMAAPGVAELQNTPRRIRSHGSVATELG